MYCSFFHSSLFPSSYHGKKIKNRKNNKYYSVRNSYSTTATLTYFDNLKTKQKDQGGKNWCYTESFMSLRI